MRYRVRQGGLMRCCIETLDSHMLTRDTSPVAGEVLPCQYCTSKMIVARDGAWEWAGASEIEAMLSKSKAAKQ